VYEGWPTSIDLTVCGSILGNHNKITINGNPASAGPKFLAFLSLFGPKNRAVTVTRGKIVRVPVSPVT
jgi:hypothetical protein